MMVRSGWLLLSVCLFVLGPAAFVQAEEPARWTPDLSSLDESIALALADRDSQTAGVYGFYRPGYFPYRAYYRPYLGVGYSYFPASYYVAPNWGYSYYAGYPYYPSYYASYAPAPFVSYTSYYAPAPVYYARPMIVAPPIGYCGCYYW